METNNSSDIPSVYCSVKQKGFSVVKLIQSKLIILLITLVVLPCGVFARIDPPPMVKLVLENSGLTDLVKIMTDKKKAIALLGAVSKKKI